MAIKNLTQNLTSTLLGGGISGKLEDWKRGALSKLRIDIGELRQNIEGVEAQSRFDHFPCDKVTDQASTEITGLAESVAANLPHAIEQEQTSRQYQAVFQICHNIARQPIQVQIKKSLGLFTALTLVEGLTTSLFFLSGGFVAGIAEALGMGLTISAVNIVVSAFVGGGFFGKFWAYGLQARENDPLIRHKRLAGRICSVLTALTIGFLLLASGIVRATGETEGLSFSFTTIGTAATDFHSIMLWAIGLSFSILAWRKGLVAFSDPYPGLTQASQAVEQAKDHVQSLYEDTLDEIEDIYAEAAEALAEMAEDATEMQQDILDDIKKLRHERETVLSALDDTEQEFQAFCAEQIELYRIVYRSKSTNQGPDVPDIGDDLAKLKKQIPIIAFDITAYNGTFSQTHKQALARLSNVRTSAIQLINQTYQNAQD